MLSQRRRHLTTWARACTDEVSHTCSRRRYPLAEERDLRAEEGEVMALRADGLDCPRGDTTDAGRVAFRNCM
jgi:hypothetical protein